MCNGEYIYKAKSTLTNNPYNAQFLDIQIFAAFDIKRGKQSKNEYPGRIGPFSLGPGDMCFSSIVLVHLGPLSLIVVLGCSPSTNS